jgi:tetratricopeptide (TPR) repeat protein
MAQICRLVAGVPLAIELAAGWVHMLSCAEIADELKRTLAADPPLEFLATSMRDVPVRHRSMRAVMDHSWKLLSGPEQHAMCQLAVFRGGFTREAAERVAGAPLTQLSALVAKSLIQRGGSGRFDLHELIRQYAAARLANEAPEQREVCQRHSLYYLGLLEDGGDLSSRPKESLAALGVEMGNLLPAWEWAAAHEDGTRLCHLSITLWYLFELLNSLVEGEMIFRDTAETLRQRDHPEQNGVRVAALAAARQLMLAHSAYFAFRVGRLEDAYAALRSSAAAMQAGTDTDAAIVVHWYLGIVCWALGRFEEAHASLQESLAQSRAQGKVLHEAWSLEFLGFVAHEQGAYERARGYFVEALSAYHHTGDRLAKSHVLFAFGRTMCGLGEYAQAETLLQEALALAREVGYATAAAGALDALGRVTQARGDLQSASALYAESAALYTGMGEVRGYARVLIHQALNVLALGDAPRAEQSMMTALRLAQECGSGPVVLEALAGLAAVPSAAPEQRLELASLVLEHPASTQDARNLAARVSAELRSHLRPEQFEAARRRACSQELAEVVRRLLASG